MQVDGGSAVVLAARKVGADLPNRLYPTYRLCLSLYLPTPLICSKPNLAPNLLFFLFLLLLLFTSPLLIRPLTPFNVLVRLTYSLLTYSQPLRSLPRGERGRASVPCGGPVQASRWPPRNSAIYSSKWVQRPTTSEGMDGAEGYTS